VEGSTLSGLCLARGLERKVVDAEWALPGAPVDLASKEARVASYWSGREVAGSKAVHGGLGGVVEEEVVGIMAWCYLCNRSRPVCPPGVKAAAWCSLQLLHEQGILRCRDSEGQMIATDAAGDVCAHCARNARASHEASRPPSSSQRVKRPSSAFTQAVDRATMPPPPPPTSASSGGRSQRSEDKRWSLER
jgi:hypothetical protein